MGIYTPEGWPDAAKIEAYGCPFVILDGGRGTGKTYTILDWIAFERKKKLIYLRRTQEEIEYCMTEEYNPFRRINHDRGSSVYIKREGKTNVFVNDGEVIGSALALSSVGKIRGMDGFDIDYIVWDEYNKDRNQRRIIKDEPDAFFNLYESINRNRELEGREPVKVFLLGNANEAANPMTMALKLVLIKERQKKKGVYPAIYKDAARGLLMIDFGNNNAISRAKRKTALYRLTEGSAFSGMALDNDFSYDEPSRQASRPIREYNPVVYVGELAIYKHKSKKLYYCTDFRRGGAPEYGSGVVELERFYHGFAWLWLSYTADVIEFENYACEVLFRKYFNA